MIVITGAAGFIGACFCRKLNDHGMKNIVLVDDFAPKMKLQNWMNLEYVDKIHRDHFFQWAENNVSHIDYIFHLGARTDYFSTDYSIFELLNVDFSQRVWSFATSKRIPLIYASSYLTNHTPSLSPFAKSKYLFDKWIEKQRQTPPFWASLKFFQVYGKNEEHKEKNGSYVYQIIKKYSEKATSICLNYNLTQDYIYVNDVAKVLYYFLNHAPKSGTYEVGTGFARPVQAIVEAVDRTGKGKQTMVLEYQKEQDFVYEADLKHLRKHAYKQAFLSLEEGVKRMFQ